MYIYHYDYYRVKMCGQNKILEECNIKDIEYKLTPNCNTKSITTYRSTETFAVPIKKNRRSPDITRPDKAFCSAILHECCPTSPMVDLNFIRYRVLCRYTSKRTHTSERVKVQLYSIYIKLLVGEIM